METPLREVCETDSVLLTENTPVQAEVGAEITAELALPRVVVESTRWMSVCRRDAGEGSGLRGCAVPARPPPSLQLHPLPVQQSEKPFESTEIVSAKRRAKRRRTELNGGEKEMAERHAHVRARIETDTAVMLNQFRESAPRVDRQSFAIPHTPDSMDAAPAAPVIAAEKTVTAIDFPGLCTKMRHLPGLDSVHVCTLGARSPVRSTDLINRLVVTSSPQVLAVDGAGSVVIPRSSRFVCSDIVAAPALLKNLKETFDLIVADPPWQNKSVGRGGGGYACLANDSLEQLPVARLCKPGTLVAVWCTNKPRHLRFVTDELFRSWGVEPIGQLHWVKLNTDGSYVHPLDSTHKKPYEPLLLGRCKTKASSKPPEHIEGTFASVPSEQHSRKPILADVLQPFLQLAPPEKKDVKCLELFGRNLLPEWTTWGNDVLRFQALGDEGLVERDTCQHCAVHVNR